MPADPLCIDPQGENMGRESGEMKKRRVDAVLRATLLLFHVSCFTHLPPSSSHPRALLTGSVWACMRERKRSRGSDGGREREREIKKALIYVKADMRGGAWLEHAARTELFS